RELGDDLLRAIQAQCLRLTRLVRSVPWDQPWPDPSAPPSVLLAHLWYSQRCRRVPSWVGLLSLLEQFVDTWDHSPKRAADAVYFRGGFLDRSLRGDTRARTFQAAASCGVRNPRRP